MYMPSKTFAETRFNENVYITEYFPLSTKTQHGVVIPAYNNGQVSHVFSDILQRFKFLGNNCVTNQPNSEPLLSLEQYTLELNSLLTRMNDMHKGCISFRTKDVNIMYDTYKTLHGSKYIAGLISIVRESVMKTITDEVVMAPEVVTTMVGFETYVASLKRVLPALTLDITTAMDMYEKYVEKQHYTGGDVKEIPFCINTVNLNQMVGVIGNAASYLNGQHIYNIVLGETESDEALDKYYNIMMTKFGLRERVAKSLLLYHPDLVGSVIGEIRNRMGMIDQSEIIWSKSYYSPARHTEAVGLFV